MELHLTSDDCLNINNAIKSKDKKILIYGEKYDEIIHVVLNSIDINYSGKEVLWLTNAVKNIRNFIGQDVNTYKTYKLKNNSITFDNYSRFSAGYHSYDIVIAYPIDQLVLDKKVSKLKELINVDANKVILLTEYDVSDLDLSYVKNNVDKVLEIEEKIEWIN